MNLGGKRVLVDTCVWVDNYCADHAGGADAKRFLQMAVGQGAELLYAVHATKDVLYVLESEFKRAARRELGTLDEPTVRAAKRAALGCMRNMCDLATAVGADVSDVWLADKYLRIHGDFEDNLVLAACRRAKADYLVTNDRALIAHADVVAKTPREMLDLMRLEV
jgi:predicted nucleic acid-binding protein